MHSIIYKAVPNVVLWQVCKAVFRKASEAQFWLFETKKASGKLEMPLLTFCSRIEAILMAGKP